jgi:hypothetical protein
MFKEIAADTELGSLVWADRAARHLDAYDSAKWNDRLTSAIPRAMQQAQRSNSKVSWMYVAGTLRLAVRQTDAGNTELREALLLPDSRMTHHFIRLALSESTHP